LTEIETGLESDVQHGQLSLVSLKKLADDILERNSLLRVPLLAEPDLLSYDRAMAKVQVFARVLYEELGRK
jgi:hypothetical protein